MTLAEYRSHKERECGETSTCPESKTGLEGWWKPPRKRLFIGLTGLVAVLLTASVLLIWIYLGTDAFHRVALRSIKTGRHTQEDIYFDSTSGIIEYQTKDGDVNADYVDDFNSFVEVVKVSTPSGVVCYASTMNETDRPDLSRIKAMSDTNKTFFYLRNAQPIPDVSFLSRKARNMCKNVLTYWTIPVWHHTVGITRQKRGKCGQICNYACRFIKNIWDCGDHCWVAEAGCFIFSLFD